MTLKDKIYEIIHLEIYKNESDCIDGIQDAANGAEKITDDFAIDFANWITNIDKEVLIKQLKHFKKEQDGK